VKAFVQPSAKTRQAFDAFASANGLRPTVISPNGDWLSITLAVSKANKLFAAGFELFEHPELKDTIARTLSVSLPSELVGHVDAIHPTTEFILPKWRLEGAAASFVDKRAAAASCNTSEPSGVITPTCLQELYGIPATPATEKSHALVTGYENKWAQKADLTVRCWSVLRRRRVNRLAFTLGVPQANAAGYSCQYDVRPAHLGRWHKPTGQWRGRSRG
jgi:tripeptidyl-peptidase-1